MGLENLLAQLIAQGSTAEEKKELISQYGPPLRGDILHDGLVGAGETWGGILGTAAGLWGGDAVGGPAGAVAGYALLNPAGALAGGWGAHEAYRAGRLIRDILSTPKDPDTAGTTVPATQSLVAGALTARPQMEQGQLNSPGVFDVASPFPYLPCTLQDKPGGLLGMMIDAGHIDPSMPDRPAVGGLVGLVQDYLRNNPGGSL